jgi:integrase
MTEPRTRKDNGESWIRETPNTRGYYEAKVWMGTKANGRPDRRHIQRKTLRAVKAKVRELEKAREEGVTGKPGKPPTVQQMMERHLTVILPSRGRAPRTIADYWSKCRNDIFPRWGGQRIDRLLPEHIEDGLAEMLAAGHAPSHVRKVHSILSSAFEVQVARRNVARNPCKHAEAPAAGEGDLTSLTQQEALAVLDAAGQRPNAARWTIGLGCGLRQGEALGLRWPYLILVPGEMRVWFQIQRLTWAHGCGDAIGKDMKEHGKPAAAIAAAVAAAEHACGGEHHKRKPCPKKCSRHTRACPPPCPADCREHARHCKKRKGGGLVFREIKEKRKKTVWLAPEFTAILREHRDAQYLQRVTADTEWEDSDLVFCQWNGKPIDPRRDWGEWGALLGAAGLPKYRLHVMRHSAASIALEEGVLLSVVQEMLGHSDVRMTRRYTHVGKALAQDASSRMGRALIRPPGAASGPKTGTKPDDR